MSWFLVTLSKPAKVLATLDVVIQAEDPAEARRQAMERASAGRYAGEKWQAPLASWEYHDVETKIADARMINTEDEMEMSRLRRDRPVGIDQV
jgi:hypothetical protein